MKFNVFISPKKGDGFHLFRRSRSMMFLFLITSHGCSKAGQNHQRPVNSKLRSKIWKNWSCCSISNVAFLSFFQVSFHFLSCGGLKKLTTFFIWCDSLHVKMKLLKFLKVFIKVMPINYTRIQKASAMREKQILSSWCILTNQNFFGKTSNWSLSKNEVLAGGKFHSLRNPHCELHWSRYWPASRIFGMINLS